MKDLRLAIIGCGGISRTHLRGIEEADQRIAVTACIDIVPERAQEAAAAFAGAVAATRIEEVMDRCDAVLISLPHDLHHPVGMTCLQAGKHVLMEKPLANSEAECLDLIAAAEEAGVTLMVGYIMRYHPLAIEFGRLIREETYGECFHVSLWTEQYTFCSPENRPWLGDHKRLGGGQLFSHGCHYIDLLLWYLGEPVEGTHVGTNRGTPWMDWEGTSDVSIRFKNRAIGYHMGTWGARGTVLRYAFHAHCTGGMLEMNRGLGEVRLHRGLAPHTSQGNDAILEPIETLFKSPGDKAAAQQLRHFVDCVETGAIPTTSARDSLQSLRVIWRLYQAERDRRVADLAGLSLLDHP